MGLLIAHVILPSSLLASAPDSSFVLVRDAKSMYSDFSEIGARISSLDNSELSTMGLVALGTVAVQSALMYSGIDEGARKIALQNQSVSHDNVLQFPNYYGTGGVALLISGGLYIGGLCSGSDALRDGGRLIVETLIVAGISTTILKGVIGRARPYTNTGMDTFKPFSFKDSFYSLPSGHCTVSFAVSSMLARRIDNVYASLLLYSAASATGIARMYYDKHWFSDVCMGAAIGIASSSLIQSVHNGKQSSDSKTSRLSIYPDLNGLCLSLEW